jgi:N-methylhydantoinase A
MSPRWESSVTRYRVSIDIGGTFTDLVVHDEEEQRSFTGKVLSTPDDPARGVITGLTDLIEDPGEISFLVHGTTVGVNAFLERRGTRVLLVTTEGFRDVYAIARGDRKKLFALQYRKPEPLIPLQDIHTVRERMLHDGTVDEPLREEDFDPIVQTIEEEGISSVAVCFLHSYVNPEHEVRAREILKKRVPELSVSLSHEVAREWREYERTSSAVLNAYIAPTVERYLESLEGQLEERGVETRLHVMQSNGGVMTASAARELPIQTLLSGPVGGTIGGGALSEVLDRPNLLCVDMGGTSFDASLIVEGQPSVSTEIELEGLPVLMSLVDIHTVGAGGGSLAYLEAGALRVGPKSAGADPGPACYGRGGTQPTVTDANLLLGRMDPEYFLGGNMDLDKGAAEEAIRGVAEKLDLAPEELAEGILAIINAKMAEAMRTITVEQGIDPREYSLVAFGGAGPMHAVALAQELEIEEVIVPPAPGTFSAFGMLQTDIRHDLTQTFYEAMDSSLSEELESIYVKLEDEAREVLEDEGVPGSRMELLRTADMRYVGQEYFVNVELPQNGRLTEDALGELNDRFHVAYETRYGHSTPGAPVEFVNLRVAALGELERDVAGFKPPSGGDVPPHDTREVLFEEERIPTKIFRRDRLPAGAQVAGSLVIEEDTATTVVPPGWGARVDELGNVIITQEGS